MNDREYNEQKRRIERLAEKWRAVLGLSWWSLKYVWDRDDKCDLDDKPGSYGCAAHTEVHWQYLRASIFFHLPTLKAHTDKELEEIVIHEFCHVLVNEMRWIDAVAESDDIHKHNINHEERVVTCLTIAFIWTREAGAKDSSAKGKRKSEVDELTLKAWQSAYDNHRKTCKKRDHSKCKP